MRYPVTILFLLLTAGLARAQDFQATFERMQKSYEQSQQFRIRMDIQAFDTEMAKTPFYTQRVDISRDANNYYYQMADQDMLLNDEHFVLVNKPAHQIVAHARNKKDEEQMQRQTPLNLDSLLKGYGKPEYLGEKQGLQKYRFREKQGAIDRIDLSFSVSEGLIREIAYHYKNGQFSRIDFTLFDLHPTFPASTFDETKYETVTKGKYQAASAYRAYQVNVNH